MTRITPSVVHTRESPNCSGRNGARPRLIVVHSTESDNITGSSRDLVNMAGYLSQPSTRASSHVIVDSDGHSARIVGDGLKAWTCAYWNPVSLNVEQIGRASQSHWSRDELRETARWIARWSKMYGIPAYKGAVNVNSGQVTRPGVVRHSELGARGGGHHDPGSSFPLDEVLALARFYKSKL